MRLRRETGNAGPRAITSATPPSRSARRPATRSAARVEGASTVTSWSSALSSRATPATCSLTSCGRDQANGVTRQTRRPIGGESSRVGRGVPGSGPAQDDRRGGFERRLALADPDDALAPQADGHDADAVERPELTLRRGLARGRSALHDRDQDLAQQRENQ